MTPHIPSPQIFLQSFSPISDDVYEVLDFSDSDIPVYILVLICLIVIAVILYIGLEFLRSTHRGIGKMIHRHIDYDDRDTPRSYSKSDRDKASRKVGHRCEGGIWFRCRHTGKDLQGDHWFPHSRGGATTNKNLVMLCRKCNGKKTDHVPDFFATWRLTQRRKKYGLEKPGEWMKG